jgi:hypothetical protein
MAYRLWQMADSRWPLRVAYRKWQMPILFLCVLCGSSFSAWAQTDELTLYVRRNVGYSGGSQIQGSFRMVVEGPGDLTSVTFKIDDQVVGTVVTQPPFQINFDTDDYGLGWHDLTAVGQTADGRSLTSTARRLEFVSAEAGWQAAGQITLPILAVVGVVVLIGMGMALIPTLTGRRSNLPLGAPRQYGLLGGTICPKCRRPFALHWWGLNASMIGRFDRCDHCGKWSFVRRVSPDKLREAEAAELALAQPETPVPEISAEEKLKRQLDESRFRE